MQTPNAAPLDRAAIARIAENLACIAGIIADGAQPTDARRRLEIVNDGVDVALAMRRLADSLRASEDAPDAAPSSTPPPIPLGAVVEVEEDADSPYKRFDGGWVDADAFRWIDADPTSRGHVVTALYHARREREEATQERDNANELRDELRCTLHRVAKRVGMAGPLDHWHHDSVEAAIDSMIGTLERERDAARRELEAAAKDQGLGASAISSRQAPNSEESDCGSAVASPAPASAPLSDPAPLSGAGNPADSGKPRRWWLNEYPHGMGYAHDTRGVADSEASSNRIACVPVVEARVTREQYEALWHDFLGYRGQLKEAFGAALTALGLTVEAGHA